MRARACWCFTAYKRVYNFIYEDTFYFLSADFVLLVLMFRLVILLKLLYAKNFLRIFS